MSTDDVVIQVDPFNSRSNVGGEYKLFCDVDLYGSLNGTPIFEWEGPGEIPTPTTITENRTRSVLTFNPLRLSHGGVYTCSARVESYPYPIQHSFRVNPNYLSMLLIYRATSM